MQQLSTDSTRPTQAFCDGGGALCPLEVANYRRLGWAGRVDWEDIMRPRRFTRRCSEVFRAAPVALRSSRSALPSGAGP